MLRIKWFAKKRAFFLTEKLSRDNSRIKLYNFHVSDVGNQEEFLRSFRVDITILYKEETVDLMQESYEEQIRNMDEQMGS